jgi:hypothetical protein
VAEKVLVSADNFNRAESDTYFARFSQGEVGVLHAHREPANADNQKVVRDNPNVLGSIGVFDLDAGAVTITMPDSGDRFMSLMVTNQDHYTSTDYQPGEHTLTRDEIGTRYVFVGVRILVDPNDSADVAAVHDLQDAIAVDQPGGPGTFEIPEWDSDSQNKVRDALVALATTLPDGNRTFGTLDQVDPVRHLMGTAIGWGGNNEHDAFYLTRYPKQNDGDTVHRLTVGDLPIDAWWAISVYNAEGYLEKNDRDVYTINSVTAVVDDDGSVTVQFGGCDDDTVNCLPIFPDWNYLVRLYRPRQEIIDGSWTFPEAQPVG